MAPKPSARKKTARPKPALPSVTLIGCGNWGTTLTLALDDAGIPLCEVIVRKKRHSNLPVKSTTLADATLTADVLWICTPDAAIAQVANQLAEALAPVARRGKPIVFHSSGALASSELAPLRKVGASVASVHPLMTFPRRSQPQSTTHRHPLAGVPFAIEGDPRACRAARTLVRAMGGEVFALPAASKPLYHAFGAFASPMLVALLTAAMKAAATTGYTPAQARRRMRPIVETTISNFFTDGPDRSFSGPIARGDAATIARHLDALRPHPQLLSIYRELARFALDSLPAQNRKKIRLLLQRPS